MNFSKKAKIHLEHYPKFYWTPDSGLLNLKVFDRMFGYRCFPFNEVIHDVRMLDYPTITPLQTKYLCQIFFLKTSRCDIYVIEIFITESFKVTWLK